MAPGSEEIHNGADDNASGTAALLESARILAGRKADLAQDLLFIGFSAKSAASSARPPSLAIRRPASI